MKVLLSGGGTGGSVTPLLAIAEELKSSDKEVDFLWIGTKKGIEKKMVESQSMKYKGICSGKFRRYFSFKNITDLALIKLGFFQSLWIIFKFKPDIILTAGSFAAVPVVWAGWVLHVPILVHQQDVKVGLANKLMSPFASIITCSLEKSVNDFKNKKVYFTGNAVRRRIFNVSSLARRRQLELSSSLDGVFNLEKNIPTLLILGGGTGSLALNEFFIKNIKNFTEFCQIINITGKDEGNLSTLLNKEGQGEVLKRYHQYEFLDNIEEAYVVADIVISRCGASSYSELAILGKFTIFIPIPNSHQEDNAKYFEDKKAAIVLKQKELGNKGLDIIKNLLVDEKLQIELGKNIKKIMPKDGARRIAEMVLKELK